MSMYDAPMLRPASADARLTPQRSQRASPAPSSSGASSPDEAEELDDDHARARITGPALVTPTALSSPGSPWPFGGTLPPGAPRRGEADLYRTDTISSRLSSSDAPKSSSLPHEILLHILKLVHSTTDLRSCLLVCKSWCQCGVELLWHKPSFHNPALLKKALAVLKRKDQTFPYAIFIKRLNFSALAPEGITDDILHQLMACERLERLTIAGNSQVTDDGISDILSVCRALVALDVSDCIKVSDNTCKAAASSCRLLQGLNLSGCKNVSDEGVMAIAESCTLLRRIKMRQLGQITDAPIQMLARHCTHLLEVDIVNCEKVTDVALWDVWRSLSHLREFSLAGCTRITDDALPQREKVGKSWQVMLKGEALAPAKPSNADIPDPPANVQPRMELIRTPVNPSNFTHLRYLDLTQLNSLSDEGIEGIVSCIPKIRNLILAKCGRLTDESLKSVAKLGRHLHYLHLGHVNNITDAAVSTLARSCTRLRYIDLACCPLLTDLSVIELAQNLSRLKRIGLVRVTRLTDHAIAALQERHSLERIHLSYCDNISVPAIAYLLQRLRKLTHLSLTGVPSFRRPELQAFCRSPPKDFNAHQRQAFCVYSGSGVAQLREFLGGMVAHAQNYTQHGMAGHSDFAHFNGFPGQSGAGPGRRFPRFAMAAAGFGQFLVGPHQQPGAGFAGPPGQAYLPHPLPHLYPRNPWGPLTADQFEQLTPQEVAARQANMAAAQADLDDDDMVDEDDEDDDNETVAAHSHPQYYQQAQLAHPQPYAPVTSGPDALATLAAAAAAVSPNSVELGGGNRWWHGQPIAGPSSAPAASTSGWPNAAAAPPPAPLIASTSRMPADTGAADDGEAEDEMDEDSGDDETMELDTRR